ncbi:IS630 family transposase [Oligosphaera ethanolica]|uniref:Transposase n=1 Tax=Oligosphaera ethanolica TaxID=760260 RepID=A0AAE3VHD3_9BACT|nr:IS630 family transposase [Oligosphaera ethanolica]MDQ0290415.1 transposase [Oligosphaera ethanolica]MDQ0291332.1 transposase [Oligosphaera ethanolica]MDQ0291852.1 transposase [Oligosphaera ethanolica]
MATIQSKLEGKNLRIMFQDEARFGRLPVIRAAWVPSGVRPLVVAAIERQFKYIYSAISPFDGDIDWSVTDMMNTENMILFLQQISRKYPDDYLLMVVDGASSHRSKEMEIPANVHLLQLPPYCPELNPVEHLWDYTREKACANRYFENLNDVVEKVEHELGKLAQGTLTMVNKVSQMFCWPWMISAI